jgi:hypothetical protein
VARRPVSIILLAIVLTAAACSGTGTSSTTTTGPPTSIDQATAQTDINQAYDTLFNLANKSVDAKLAVIQNGAALRAAITQALRSSLAATAAGATVGGIELLDRAGCQSAVVPWPCAKVTYDILGPDRQPVLSNAGGFAVFLTGRWLVAKNTICGLLSLLAQQGSGSSHGSPAGC